MAVTTPADAVASASFVSGTCTARRQRSAAYLDICAAEEDATYHQPIP